MEQDLLLQEIKKAESDKQANRFLKHRRQKPLWREYVETAMIALIAAILLRVFVVSAYRVSSASMEDSLFEGDYIFVNKLAYEFDNLPQVNDIIVFKYPNNPQKDFIKRVVALPGETVEIVDKILYVNGDVALSPLHSKNSDQRIIPMDLSFRDNFGPYYVPEGTYFVLGDNRDDSQDSRFWGIVPKENIKGRAVFVYWSWAPDPNPPGWDFPYIVDLFQWIGHIIWNGPSHIRWSRLGTSL